MARIGSIDIILNSQNIANNTSSITVKGYCQTTGESWRGDHRTGTYTIKQGSTVLKSGSYTIGAPANTKTTLFAVTLTVAHDANGKSGTITATFNYDSGWCTGTQSKTLTNIARASVPTLSASSVDFGGKITVYTNRKNSAFTHHLYYSINGGSEVGIAADIGANTTWTIPESLMNNIPNATSATIKLKLYTFSGSTNIGNNTISFTAKVPANVVPTCDFTVTDPDGYLNTYGYYIKGISKAKVVVTTTKAYGSDIASYKVTIDGNTYTTNSFTTGELKGTGSLSVVATVTDKRGRSGSHTKKIEVIDYNQPLFDSLKVKRCNADGSENILGEYGKVSFNCSFSSLNGKNSTSCKVEYKKTSDSSFATHETIQASSGELSSVFPADSSFSYNVRITATDDLQATIYTTVLSTGFAIIHWLASGHGLALGKIAEIDGVLDIGFQTRFTGGILQPVIENETDLDTLVIPNVYAGNAPNISGYVNCPITTGTTFTLEVFLAGGEGQIMQRITTCTKGTPVVYIRCFYSNEWGEWVTI